MVEYFLEECASPKQLVSSYRPKMPPQSVQHTNTHTHTHTLSKQSSCVVLGYSLKPPCIWEYRGTSDIADTLNNGTTVSATHTLPQTEYTVSFNGHAYWNTKELTISLQWRNCSLPKGQPPERQCTHPLLKVPL